MVVTRIQSNKPPPLDPEVEGVFVGEEEVGRSSRRRGTFC